jgi:GntR family negative regulator for fad regulon and positive regulator of fabA
MDWDAPAKPAELAESRLVSAIIDGRFPIDSNLPPERELAEQLGVTRPTLREALQRLARDGWIEIHHGRSTRVRDYWKEGSLAVLGTIAVRAQVMPPNFVSQLLEVRLLLAPTYARQAIEQAPAEIAALLEPYKNLPDDPTAFTDADWNLHYTLTTYCGNPIFTLILNGFQELYHMMGKIYFATPSARNRSRTFYSMLGKAARAGEPDAAEAVTRRVMQDSLNLWLEAISQGEKPL